MPSTSTLFSTYASITTSVALLRSIANQLIPHQLQNLLSSKLEYLLFLPKSSELTLIIEGSDAYSKNELYEACQIYLGTIISPSVERLRVKKVPKENKLVLSIDSGQEIVDDFEDIEVKWKLIAQKKDEHMNTSVEQHFQLRFNKKERERVLNSYLTYVLNTAKIIKQQNKVAKLHTVDRGRGFWKEIILQHPATFDTLAMDHKLKREIVEDLDRFVKRREFYKRVGKAWKRGYLLYGPPGTGKSTLVAAMANYLKFDIYDFELSNVTSNDELRRYLLATANRSILVIEDIDCSIDLQNRDKDQDFKDFGNKLTLSGLLNFIDGLWSSCGDERIIIFTTNHKDSLDQALLRPGRMDMHIHLSYCTTQGFNILALNYLGLHKNNNNNERYLEIENSIDKYQVTPAEVAEELMKSEDVDIALEGLLNFLKRKKMESDEQQVQVEIKDECIKPKRQKSW
ncbi:Aaa-atpase [Thalictrum thalictroides]|uniref:Aaa-atpase n=1 Tax=Thalictrum thalictroides TaxID=46969 RepID=A0A7J6VW49_THATH|nr:Aaa-atpase [Thalictrum thalictroides]